jgi:fructokinase
MGARGAIAFDGARKLEIPSHAERVVDATGAGDAFTAGVLSLLVRGGSFDEALQLGAELAGRAVTEVGATTALLRLEPRS